MTSTTDWKPGDRVGIDHVNCRGRVFILERKMTKNWRATPEGGGRPVTVDPLLLVPATDVGNAVVTAIPILNPGQTVKLRNRDGVFVVLKSTQRGYSVALLGGEDGRYWNVDGRALTPVKISFTEE